MARIKYWNEAKGIWDYADGGTPLETIQQATDESIQKINSSTAAVVNNVTAEGTKQIKAVTDEGVTQVGLVTQKGAEKIQELNTFVAGIEGDRLQIQKNQRNITVLQKEIESIHPNDGTWAKVKANIALGNKRELYPIGKVFNEAHTAFTDLDVEVIDYDHVKAADGLNGSNVAFQLVNAINGYQFDRPEFLFYVESAEGLKAGIYNFHATRPYESNDENPCGRDTDYSFTLTSPIPQGGGIAMEWGYRADIATAKIKTYKNSYCKSSDLIETVTVRVGKEGSELSPGTNNTDGKGKINHIDRIHYGSNNLAQSGVIQWLNGIGKNWWKKQTIWDTAPTYVDQEGFLGGFSQDFIDNITPVKMKIATNGIYETNSLDGTVFNINSSYDYICKIFPLSMTEYGWGNNNGVTEGEVLDIYKNIKTSNADKIKYDKGRTARYVWLRSPYPWYCLSERDVSTDGSLSSRHASLGIAVAPGFLVAENSIKSA